MLKAVYKEVRGLHEAAYILALFTFASQLLALIRDRLLAHQFGAGAELDLYYTAFRIPDLMFVIFASVLSVYVLIPFVSNALLEQGKVAAQKLLSSVYTLFLIAYGLIAGVVVLYAHQIVPVLFPGFTGEEQVMIVLLLRVLMLQPLLLSLSNLFGVVTQLSDHFVLYALSPLLYNIGIIFGIVVLYPFMGLSGLAWGVVVGSLLHMAVQIPHVERSGLMPRLTTSFNFKILSQVLKTSIPRALTLSLHQIVLVVFAGVASFMAVGSVSVFQFALNLQSVPLGLIGVSYSVAAFPTLARMFSSGNRTEFVNYVATALRHIFFWSIPAIALIIVIRAQIVRVILGTGAFNWDDTRLTAAALAIFVLSLAAQGINLLIVRAFYAGGDTRTPFWITIFSTTGSLVFAFFFHTLFLTSPHFAYTIESLFRVVGVEGTDVLMLPLAFTVALTLHTLVLTAIFMKRFSLSLFVFIGSCVRGLIAAITGGVTSYALLNTLVFGIKDDTFLGIFLQGFISGTVGIGIVIGTLYVLRSPELFEVSRAFHRRIFKTNIIAPQQSDDVAV